MSIRVLLIAEACNPSWVSVPLVGWSHCRAIQLLPDIDGLIATQVRNRTAIENVGLREGIDFVSIDTEKLAAPAYKLAGMLRGGKNKGWTTVTAIQSLTYPYFERQIWKRLGERIRKGEFDIVHRVTPLSPTAPSLLAKLCRSNGVPFVLGPLNGGVPWPKGFDADRRREREWLSYMRGMYRAFPGFERTRRHASAIVIGSIDTWNQMPERFHDKCIYIPENGIDPKRFHQRRTHHAQRPLQVIFVGRLVPYKGAGMLIDAAAPLIRAGDVRLKIIGDGPERESLRARAQAAGVASGTEFLGHIGHETLQDHLASSDLFAFPSIREFGGAVVLEAMAVGLVPLVVNYGGVGELVSERTGFAVEMGSRDEIVASFREVLESVVSDPSVLVARSSAAHEHALSMYSWEAKASQTREVYRWVLGERPDIPSWGMPFRQAMKHTQLHNSL